MNIREVARKANVSTATVSRTINGSDKVSPETAERVRTAILALNYYPNTNARALGSGRSRLYGLIISDITNPFFPDLVKSFEDVAVTHGQDVIIANTGYSSERTELCVQRMLERKVDGVAIMTSEMDAHLIDRLSSRHIPIVFLDTGRLGMGISNIVVDYGKGIRAALAHLVELGHERIAFISGPMNLASARARRDAFLAAAEEYGIPLKDELMELANHRPDGGRLAMERLLDRKPWPTAVVSSNDLTAIGAIGAIHQRNLRVPEDISVAGFDDIELCSFMHPTMTTVRLSRSEIAERAFHALYTENPKEERPGVEYRIEPQLIVRNSTGANPER
ncbi:MAG TPA: LacI family DNA-binding transcriptional regulator [Acidisarcina sp.]|nr:LacI family DNA-binding transcriptional regulator [Acidisarcina sp.]